MKTLTSIVAFSLTSLSVINITVGQTTPTPTPTPIISSAPTAPTPPTMTTPAATMSTARQSGAPMPPTNAMDNFRRNQERMQRMNAMQRGAPQLDAAKKAAAAAKQKSEVAGARAAQTITSESVAKPLAETTKPAPQTSASPTASASATEPPKH